MPVNREVVRWTARGLAILGSILSGCVLGAAFWVHKSPAKVIINRLSVRLLLLAMVFSMAYDFSFLVVMRYTSLKVSDELCDSAVYFLVSTQAVVSYLCTCIAINLMLKICFGVDTVKCKLERWYMAISITLGMGQPIIPAALRHFGSDDGVCWFETMDPDTRSKWLIVDIYMWQSLSSVIAFISVIMVLFSIFKQARAPLQGGGFWSKKNRPALGEHETVFLRIAAKIVIYPAVLVIVNTIMTSTDLYLARHGINEDTFSVYWAFVTVAAARGIIFALLALTIDPCLPVGIKAAWRAERILPPSPPQDFSQMLSTGLPIEECPTPRMEIVQALSIEGAHSTPVCLKDCKFTHSFHGVPADSLPEGITDDVDLQSLKADSQIMFVPLTPDLPDEAEETRRVRLAEEGHQHVEAELALRKFFEVKSQL